jgi:hypothetical protein
MENLLGILNIGVNFFQMFVLVSDININKHDFHRKLTFVTFISVVSNICVVIM